ncbi:MAG: hypothetical protein HRJ53_01145 [Acidobacteria bacterium Pan2503]|uniref:Uncharacterized protein n=1 Tax=Candidatus Acidiferrum panamense TaxID=2741543 RepID=A0A7V8SV81_9BACT|nr:hypothetical protein [Candidatus Acidoferrum panamensis]
MALGLDVFAPIGAVAQHLPQVKNVAGQIAFLNENTRSHFFEQLFFFDDVPGPLDQGKEGFKVLWRERDRLSVAQQNSLLGFELVGSECV